VAFFWPIFVINFLKPKQSNNAMQKMKTICQSCGIPLLCENTGTNFDMSLNHEYCKFCYINGNFSIPDLTIKQQIERLSEIAVRKFGTSKEDAVKQAQRLLPTLKRWQ
jgi:hypothetical protein